MICCSSNITIISIISSSSMIIIIPRLPAGRAPEPPWAGGAGCYIAYNLV